ncbi:MAG: diaminopimelate epimerase [Betaproteobacteria bacterium]|nr:diaminopimelate epimerase [Betaproteobacteria bacterium]
MLLRFTKMHGQGNDFVMLDGVSQRIELTPGIVRRLANRHFGIGCDQVLLVEPASRADCDFRYRIFNADGGEVEQCGNGARCFVDFVRHIGLTGKGSIRVETLGGVIEPSVNADGTVTVNFGAPRFEPATLPFLAGQREDAYALEVDGRTVTILALAIGNPHAVQRVDDVDTAPVATLGPLIEHHPRFPQRVNAGFMQVIDRTHIRLRVWERGAGETLACGTGACAAVVTGIRWGLLDETVHVAARGGELTVTWPGLHDPMAPVLMRGATARVFTGEVELSELKE